MEELLSLSMILGPQVMPNSPVICRLSVSTACAYSSLTTKQMPGVFSLWFLKRRVLLSPRQAVQKRLWSYFLASGQKF